MIRAMIRAAMIAIRFRPQAQNPRRLFCLTWPNFSASLSLHTLTLRLLPLAICSSLLSLGVFNLPPVMTDMKPGFFSLLCPCCTGPTCWCDGSLQKVLSVVTLILAVDEGDLERVASRITERRWPAGVEMRFAGRSSSMGWWVLARLDRTKFIGAVTLGGIDAYRDAWVGFSVGAVQMLPMLGVMFWFLFQLVCGGLGA